MADGAIDPIHQFEVTTYQALDLGGWDISFTNAAAYLLLASGLVIAFFSLASRSAMVPGRLQSLGEISYEFIANMIRSTAGEDGLKYFPFVFTLFFFILAANLIGMFPYAFTTTSHIIVTGVLAMTVFTLVTLIGIFKNGFGWLKLFAPSGIPWPIYILLVPIEIISYFARPLTLAFRLFANMLAGHIMLKLIVSFAALMATFGLVGWVGTTLTVTMAVAITALEFLVAFLQAYVFAILTCVYLSDALHPGH
ncbi:MAG: F0F1 ATP synthase subunit A [Hyphomonadaceae bacterium]|nr:F0F1 ATP synthase subunit A [Hyphomonadaceae bacterium]